MIYTLTKIIPLKYAVLDSFMKHSHYKQSEVYLTICVDSVIKCVHQHCSLSTKDCLR